MKIVMPEFEKARVLVVGDVMLDRYMQGSTSRISPEAPVPVVKVASEQECPGGAANVALNLSALGVETSIIGLVGKDEAADMLDKRLGEANVKHKLLRIKEVPTTVKLRVMARHQQLLRLDFEKDFSMVDKKPLEKQLKKSIKEADVLVLSDYAKGALSSIKTFMQIAKDANVPVIVDPKSEDFSLYEGAHVVTPNLKEFQAVVGHCNNDDELFEKGRQLMARFRIHALLVTRGEQGMVLLQDDKPPLVLQTHAKEVFDVTGAGDTVISTIAAMVASKVTLEEAAMMSNIAAGVSVTKLGAAAVTLPELRRSVQRYHDSEIGVLTQDQCAQTVEDARAHGERVVMTNGCFDLLHAGHVAYLEQAKQLGDRLVVAVNSDESVARLKGDDRPVVSVENRAAVLAGLRSVDWVISFSEDTPHNVLKLLKPDVLVKGGDYQPETVVGAEIVKAYGGEVKVLGFVKDCSTSSMIDKIIK